MNLPVELRREWIRSRREQRKLMRRARLRRQMMRYALLVFLMFIAASGFCYLPWSLANPDQQIIVKGNKVVTDEQVRTALEASLARPLYSLNPHDLEAEVKSLDVVQQAFVRRYCLPTPKLVVDVLEEFPWASYATEPDQEAQWVIAESGRRISISQFPSIIQPPLKIYGRPARQFTSKDVSQWATWLAYIEKQTQSQVEMLDMTNPQDVRVQVGDLYLKLGSPDATLTRRLSRLSSVLSAIEPLRNRLEFVDLGLDNNVPLKLAKKVEGSRGSGQSANVHSQL
jgi:cell division septal protein FtsQ